MSSRFLHRCVHLDILASRCVIGVHPTNAELHPHHHLMSSMIRFNYFVCQSHSTKLLLVLGSDGCLDGDGGFCACPRSYRAFSCIKNLPTLTRHLFSAYLIKTQTQTHSVSSDTTIFGPSSMLVSVFMTAVIKGRIAPSETRTTRRKSLPSVQLLGQPANQPPHLHQKMIGICL